MADKKLILGWFSFTCCEDSSIVFTELLNEYFFIWKELIEFRHIKMLKSKNELKDLDVAFVEGAISSDEQKVYLEEIRSNCKKLIAIGSCACTGKPSANRNDFPPEVMDKYQDILERFQYSEKVHQLDELVQVDDKVMGCPMNTKLFLAKLEDLFQEFNIKQ